MLRQICGGYVHTQPSAAMIQTQPWALEVAPKAVHFQKRKGHARERVPLVFSQFSLKPLITVILKDKILEKKILTLQICL